MAPHTTLMEKMRLRQPRRHGARLDLILTEDASVLVVVPFLHASPIVLRIMPYRPRMTIRADGVQSGDAGRTEENQTLLLIYPRVLMLLCVIWGLFGARGDGTSDNSARDAAGRRYTIRKSNARRQTELACQSA